MVVTENFAYFTEIQIQNKVTIGLKCHEKLLHNLGGPDLDYMWEGWWQNLGKKYVYCVEFPVHHVKLNELRQQTSNMCYQLRLTVNEYLE